MKKILILLTLAITFTACKDSKKSLDDTNNVAAKQTVPIQLFVFDGGTVQVNALEIFSEDDLYKGESKTFADMFFVIKHPEGNLLWDAGLSERFIGRAPFTTPNGAFTLSRQKGLDEQLKTIGLTTEDFKYIALSHTHFDHSGSASKLSHATWLVQQSEYDFVTSEVQQKEAPDNYNAIKDLKNIKKINGDFDVFNDGKVIIKSTPGHTPGHQSLFLELEQEGPILLTGDLYHFEENRSNKIVPSFNHSYENTKQSMEVFETFAENKKARVIIQHSIKDFNSLNHAPEPIQ